MSKWSEILPQDALYLATELEAHAQEERDNGKILYPPQEQIFRALQLTKPEDVLSSHPSPFSATRPCRGTPAFRGSKPFSTANKLLTDMGGTPIDWSL